MSDRIGGYGRVPGESDEYGLCPSRTFTRLELLEKTLTAVENQEGVLHGTMSNDTNTAFCSLGAFAHENINNLVNRCDAEFIQEQNDNYPEATPVQRRIYMIAWLKKQIDIETLKNSLRWPVDNIGEKR